MMVGAGACSIGAGMSGSANGVKGGKGDRVIRWRHLMVSVRAQVYKWLLLGIPARWHLVLLVMELERRLLR